MGRLPNSHKTPSSVCWCLTINNYTEEDITITRDFGKTCKYAIIGKEVGEQGTPHLQVYLSLEKKLPFNAIKAIFPTAHIERAKGSARQNRLYCSKENNFEEFGTIPTPGTRSDLKEYFHMVQEGMSLEQIIVSSEGSALCHENHIRKLIELKNKGDRLKIIKEQGIHALPVKDVRFYWGKTGTGKTSSALQEHPESHIQGGCRWFDGYDSHTHVVFDEFVSKAFPASLLLRITDKYPLRLEVKGGFIDWNPTTIIFTTNETPEEWFADWMPAHKEAMMRRITTIKEFNSIA